jgi:hypothetical protein
VPKRRSIEIHDLPGIYGNPAYDPSQPSLLEFDFQVTPPGHGTIAIDGHVEPEDQYRPS